MSGCLRQSVEKSKFSSPGSGGREPWEYSNGTPSACSPLIGTGSRDAIDIVASCGYIVSMRTVGIRELKNSLSEYLRRVRAGESVLVTDRGEVVAELTPPGRGSIDASVPSGVLALARRGLASVGTAADASLYRSLPRKGRRRFTSAQLLDEERGSK